jgi:dCTP deaminase
MSIFFYEIIERIVRFTVHLEEIEEQFYSDNENKKSLINDYKNQLFKLLSWLLQKGTDDTVQDDLIRAQELINELHKDYLSILPRPHEPIELTRFERVIKTQIVKLNAENIRDISIALNEEIGENTQTDYLSNFKKKITMATNLTNEECNTNDKLYITIPRIDASNTFRWPSLIHEMCHSLIEKVKFNSGSIEKEFLSFIGGRSEQIFDKSFIEGIKSSSGNITRKNENEQNIPNLSNWLTECWCDLFACILIGPSLYFSQFTVFLNSCKNMDVTSHPPHQLRLSLIESIINHRFPLLYKELLMPYMEKCNSLIEILQKDSDFNFDSCPILNDIFNSFSQFFLTFFFLEADNTTKIKDNPELSEKLTDIIKKYVTIQHDIISYLTGCLKQGLPIPSIKTGNSDDTYKEIPTYVQEIFLASWLAKLPSDSELENVGLISRTLKVIDELKQKEQIEDVYDKIKKIIVRHDQAVLKSIQVSEWFDLFNAENERKNNIDLFAPKQDDNNLDKVKGVLVDKEIKSLIFQDKLKIIPLMYMGQNIHNKKCKQIGTTSVDIRLGTSFQVFYPDQYGIIDFTKQDNMYSYKKSSQRIDLDFLESITITPGQFLLGHSMEYIKLPDYICGNLEGRSSFARLGIEIHMTAGFIDPGFEGVITLEIYNAGSTTVRLYPGMRIGQIRFEKNSDPDEKYKDKQDVKYKGLLEHNVSLQSKDIEVELIKEYLRKQNKQL